MSARIGSERSARYRSVPKLICAASNTHRLPLQTRTRLKGYRDKSVCAPVTRTVRPIPSELRLGPDDGMPVTCAASFDKLRTFPEAALTARITRLHPERLLGACGAAHRRGVLSDQG